MSTITLARTIKKEQSSRLRRYRTKNLQGEKLYRTLINDGCEDLYNYITWIDMAEVADFFVLPATTSCCYLPKNLKKSEIVINLSPLNLINDLKSFLTKVCSLMSEYSYLTGYFENNSTSQHSYSYNNYVTASDLKNRTVKTRHKGFNNIWASKRLKHLYSPHPNHLITMESLELNFKINGFTIKNLTSYKGITYFCAQKRS